MEHGKENNKRWQRKEKAGKVWAELRQQRVATAKASSFAPRSGKRWERYGGSRFVAGSNRDKAAPSPSAPPAQRTGRVRLAPAATAAPRGASPALRGVSERPQVPRQFGRGIAHDCPARENSGAPTLENESYSSRGTPGLPARLVSLQESDA